MGKEKLSMYINNNEEPEEGFNEIDYILNNKHDITSYEICDYKREILPMRKVSDANALYDAYLRSKQGTDWKQKVQQFEAQWLLGLGKIQRDILNRTYKPQKGTNFIINERGKTRYITGEVIEDRIVKHALCDDQLNPSIYPKLIYTNSASQKGKGIEFARNNLCKHLHKFYIENGNSNDGHALVVDFRKFYDNVRHDNLKKIFEKYVYDEEALWLIGVILEHAKVDVSYMTDEEYAECMDILFDSLEYSQIDKSLFTGKKFMAKHLNVGDQLSQTAGICYPMQIDNYVKIVCGCKYYGRYMDDSYIIHRDKQFLEEMLEKIKVLCKELGITINEKKTSIHKLSEGFKFLQVKFTLTDTGKVIKRKPKDKVNKQRRRMKRVAKNMDSKKEFTDWFNSWLGSHCKYMTQYQISNMVELFEKLKEEYFNGDNKECNNNVSGRDTDQESPSEWE
jgi:hypothetical protein